MRESRPLVIAHRGASGYRPEHTLASYELAIEQRADVIEPDLVVTRDGVLIARHENEISGTTNVAAHPEFADRQTTKTIDGVPTNGWFSEDFTLAEIKSLRARERLPDIRPDNARYDGHYEIPTFAEIIALARTAPYPVAIYPETKHPTWFAHEGHHLDGSPIHYSLGQHLIDELVAARFTDPRRVYIQSFEIANLIELKRTIMPAAGVDFPLMQLFGDIAPAVSSKADWSMPWDLRWHVTRGDDLASIYGDLPALLGSAMHSETRFADLQSPSVLAWMRRSYASGVAPWKDNLLPRTVPPAASSGPTGLHARLTGAAHPLIERAHQAGLQVHTYTLRAEANFEVASESGAPLSVEDEAIALLDAGVDAYFIDQPDRGVSARDRWLAGRNIAKY
ncbi:MAG: glycerophosphodiester phosphodiesterase family protein [Tahibacter sp.]